MSELPFKLIKINKESFDQLESKRKNTMYIVNDEGRFMLFFENTILTSGDDFEGLENIMNGGFL